MDVWLMAPSQQLLVWDFGRRVCERREEKKLSLLPLRRLLQSGNTRGGGYNYLQTAPTVSC
jgi:hypothetical protein